MPERNAEIKRKFEITDDALQSLLGFHHFVDSAITIAPDSSVRGLLPREKIWITPDWERYYDREELLLFMRRWFTPILSRNLFVAVVSYFDAAIEDFLRYLLEKQIDCDFVLGDMPSYRRRLEWVFRRVKNSRFGTPGKPELIPNCCLEADHARRIRNIIMHNQGRFDEKYGRDFIRVDEILENASLQPIFHLDYAQFRTNPESLVPLIVSFGGFVESLRHHVRLLHLLHNEIQLQYFQYPTGYSYAEEGKRLEWHRVFFGV